MIYSLDELAKGKGNPNIQRTIANCKRERSINREVNRGYTPKRTMRKIAEIPMEFLFNHPESMKYFDNDHDVHERKKHIFSFLKKYGRRFMVVDNL